MDKIKLIVTVSVVGTAVLTASLYNAGNRLAALREKAGQTEVAQKELSYYEEAEKINDFYYSKGVVTRGAVIRQTLKAIDKNLPKYFPDGPFTRRDFIAMAMVESGFNQYLVGTHKEYGIFQIMPESALWAGVKKNQFDVDVNTEMAMFVLSKKQEQYSTYKLTVIGYNGIVKTSKGKISETYWKLFKKARNDIDDILGDSHLPSK